MKSKSALSGLSEQ